MSNTKKCSSISWKWSTSQI